MSEWQFSVAVTMLMGAGFAFFMYRTKRDFGEKLDAAAKDIRKVEIATNSIKDALVAATAKASFSEGVEAGRAESREVK